MLPSVRFRVQLLTQKRDGSQLFFFFFTIFVLCMDNKETASNCNVVYSPMFQQAEINEKATLIEAGHLKI